MRTLIASVFLACVAAQARLIINPPHVLINGVEVPAGERPDIVNIRTGNAGCTAAVAGPRVVITASHCGSNGATSVFSVGGRQYQGKFKRSPLYPGKDHDVAVIIASSDIDMGTKPYTSVMKGSLKVGDKLKIYGYGCTNPGGGGGNDGKLRTGDATITGFSGYDAVSTNGAALCFGDSGGPAYVTVDGKQYQATVNSKGDIKKTNYTARLDMDETVKFFQDVIASEKVDICGVNKVCDGGPTPPPGGDSFTLTGRVAKEMTVKVADPADLEFVKRQAQMLMMYLDGQTSDIRRLPREE